QLAQTLGRELLIRGEVLRLGDELFVLVFGGVKVALVLGDRSQAEAGGDGRVFLVGVVVDDRLIGFGGAADQLPGVANSERRLRRRAGKGRKRRQRPGKIAL